MGVAYPLTMDTQPLADDYPLTNATAAVDGASALEGHLLTAGECAVVSRWNGLPRDAAHLYARLLGRVNKPVRLDRLKVPGMVNLVPAIERLASEGFIDPRPLIPRELQRAQMTVPELRALARSLGEDPKGPKDALLSTLEGQPLGDSPVPMIRVRHAGLFRRLFRAHLQNHDGDLSAVVLKQMGRVLQAAYRPTAGSGRFPNRAGMLDYENALQAFRGQCDAHAWERGWHTARSRLKITPLAPVDRWRFSGRRFWEAAAGRCLREAERHLEPIDSLSHYQELLELDLHEPHRVRHRAALVAGRAGRYALGVDLCAETPTLGCEAYPLIRTGQRLSKRAGVDWSGPVLPAAPTPTKVELPFKRNQGTWKADGDDRSVSTERATIEHLRSLGRRAIHVEGSLWTTLFALLYREAMFAPVHGALPSPHLRKPLDFGTHLFSSRRHKWMSPVDEAIATGQAETLIRQTWDAHEGESVAGLHWSLLTVDELVEVVAHVPPPSLVAIMNQIAQGGARVANGMPDIVVLPGSATVYGLTTGLAFIELKGPGDSLRDAQRWWLHRLQNAGLFAEIWSVTPRSG